jgi:hypothetical protein
MTSITSIPGIDMIWTFAGCDTIVVATDTSSYHRIMIHRSCCNGSPRRGSRLMAGIAKIRGIQMIRAFAGRSDIVVAVNAITVK